MKIDCYLMLSNLAGAGSAARAAEAIGFDGLWLGETSHDAILPQPLIAQSTERLQFGTAITLAFVRSPMALASCAWDLASQSGGRFILGLGTQVKAHIERRFGMTWSPPVSRMREVILAIRAIWRCWQDGEPLNFKGEAYKFTLMTPFFNPGPIANPKVPIFVAGVNAGMCRLAGELADGFHVHPFHSIKYLRESILPSITSGTAGANRARSDLELVAPVFAVTDDAERERVRAQLAFYASTPTYRAVLDCHGWGAVGERLSHLAARGRWDAMPAEISDEILETFATVGRSEDLPRLIRAKYAGVVDRVLLYEPFEPGKRDDLWRDLVTGFREIG